MCDYGPFQNVPSHKRRRRRTQTNTHAQTEVLLVVWEHYILSPELNKMQNISCAISRTYPALQCCCRPANVPEGNDMTVCPQSFDLCDIQCLEKKKMDELLLISTEECLKCSNLELQESLVRHFRGDKYSNSDEHHTHDSGLQLEVTKLQSCAVGGFWLGDSPREV